MPSLDSKLQRALIFLSDLDAVTQHLIEVYALGDRVYFRIALGHQHSLQHCALTELAALLQRPARALKAQIRQATQRTPEPALRARLALAIAQKQHFSWVFRPF